MTLHHCTSDAAQHTGRHRSSSPRRKGLIGWIITIVPTAILALLPKCPLCIAVWLAAAGLGLSLSTIAHLRMVLLVLCIASLTALAASRLLRAIR